MRKTAEKQNRNLPAFASARYWDMGGIGSVELHFYGLTDYMISTFFQHYG